MMSRNDTGDAAMLKIESSELRLFSSSWMPRRGIGTTLKIAGKCMHASADKAIFILLDAAARHWDYSENSREMHACVSG